jgi:hypothetical protein
VPIGGKTIATIRINRCIGRTARPHYSPLGEPLRGDGGGVDRQPAACGAVGPAGMFSRKRLIFACPHDKRPHCVYKNTRAKAFAKFLRPGCNQAVSILALA